MIIAPPYSLSLECMKLLEGNFNVLCHQKVSAVRRFSKPETGAKQLLVLTESFDGILELSKQYNLTLFVQKIEARTTEELLKRYYANSETYKSIVSGTGVKSIREITANIDKQTKEIVHKIGNPGKILF